jgi:NADH-quinone oxidoreductase subunit M
MSSAHLPWLETAVLIPLVGAIIVGRVGLIDTRFRVFLVFASATFACTIGAWCDFLLFPPTRAITAVSPRNLDLFARVFDGHLLAMNELVAPLLPLTALIFLLTGLTSPRATMRHSSFPGMLVSEALVLSTLACREPWGVILFLSLAAIPPYFELRARKRPTRVYALHMGLFVASMVIGWLLIETHERIGVPKLWGIVPLLVAVFIRSGIAPFHCWVSDLYEHATFRTALMYTTPMMGAYAAVRLVLPVASDGVVRSMGVMSLAMALYAAGLAVVQREARRFFCYVFLSHSALVLSGLETVSPIGLTGALCVWISVGLSLTGLGLTISALEARHGRLSLTGYHGVYEHTPLLAVCFLLTAMASVGFPGTFGFLGTEMVVDDAVHTFPSVGFVVVIAAALNGIAVVHAYFKLFTGTRFVSAVPLKVAPRERVAVLCLSALIFGGALYPQPMIQSRYRAAEQLLTRRTELRRTPQLGAPEESTPPARAAARPIETIGRSR